MCVYVPVCACVCCLFGVCLLFVWRVFVVCLACVCRVFVVCLACVCRVFGVCLSCVCRVFVVCLACVCCLFVVCLACVWRVFGVYFFGGKFPRPLHCSYQSSASSPDGFITVVRVLLMGGPLYGFIGNDVYLFRCVCLGDTAQN